MSIVAARMSTVIQRSEVMARTTSGVTRSARALAVQQQVERVIHRSRRRDLLAVDEEYLVGVLDCVQAVRNDHLRGRRWKLAKDLLQELLGDSIDVGRRLIQHEDLRFPQD